MNISYSWLKEYIDLSISPDEVAERLTMLGLEVGKIDRSGSVPGGLAGVVVGEVLSAERHPNADKLSVCKVNIGTEILPIVCGAPNVAAGQKVPVATIGTTLYPFGQGEEGAFKIKKGKIRGEESWGMICAEDELGLGPDHDGILVLAPEATVGSPAAAYLDLREEVVLEVDLTPNRVDAASHYGVARDLAAALGTRARLPRIQTDPASLPASHPIRVEIQDPGRCQRYSSVFIEGVQVAESPEWLRERLSAVGLRPINNVVDVTNFVLHELGQPLHAFDADEIRGGTILVKTPAQPESFVTLDQVTRQLAPGEDLMICDTERALCMAGVMGGLNSGVNAATRNIFLESAYFDAGTVRRSSKRHGIHTDSSFRFERGADPNMTVTAALRAAELIVEVAGGRIVGLNDLALGSFPHTEVSFSVAKAQRLIGKDVPKQEMIAILEALEIRVEAVNDDLLKLLVPPYRVDVKRDVDVIEDLLRVYGYNRVELPAQMHSSLDYRKRQNLFRFKETVANYFSASGYYEILNNSLVPRSLGNEKAVSLANPLSEDLAILRQSMLPGALETLRYNQNRQQEGLRVFEFGKTYQKKSETDYQEQSWLAITVAGQKHPMHWEAKAPVSTLFSLTKEVERLKAWARVEGKIRECEDEEFAYGLEWVVQGQALLRYGRVARTLETAFDLRMETYHLRLDWDAFVKVYNQQTVRYAPVPQFPAVRRDLSLLIKRDQSFAQIKQVIEKANAALIRSVSLHDVYQGKGMADDEKSYLVSVELQDAAKTLDDQVVEKVMGAVIQSLDRQLGARLRA